MFERYTENARKAVFMARYQANWSASEHIETEHLALGILLTDTHLAARLLLPPDKMEAIREQVQQRHGRREASETTVDVPLSQETKRTMVRADREAQNRKQKHIGCEHLLLGIFLEEGCFGSTILQEHGVSAESLAAAADSSTAERGAPAQTGRVDALEEARIAMQSLLASKSVELEPAVPVVRNLSEAAKEGKLDPLIGRQREQERVIQVLTRKTRNNALLIGEPGVGKTALVEGLAQRICDCTVPASLLERLVFRVDALSLFAPGRSGQSTRSTRRLIAELKVSSAVILCVEGLLDSAAGSPWDAVGAAHVLELFARHGIQCLATSTPGGLRLAIENAAVLLRFFEVVEVAPPADDEAIRILHGVKALYEKFHDVTYAEGVIEAAVFASGRFLPHRYLPGRALDLLDEAGALARIRKQKSVNVSDLEQTIAGRTGASLPLVQQILAQRKGKDPQSAAERLAAAVSPDRQDWLPFLGAYLAGSSHEERQKLARAIAGFPQE